MTRLVRPLLRPFTGQLALLAVLLVVQVAGNLCLPALNARIIDRGILLDDIDQVLTAGWIMLLAASVLGAVSLGATALIARIAMGASRNLRRQLIRTIQSYSLTEINSLGTASLSTRVTNDVQQIQQFLVSSLAMVIVVPVTLVGGVALTMRVDVRLSSVLVAAICAMTVFSYFMVRLTLPFTRDAQASLDAVNLLLREYLAGIRVVRAFVRTADEHSRFRQASRRLTGSAISANSLSALVTPSVIGAFNLTNIATLWFGEQRVHSGAIQIGDLVAFLMYAMQILSSLVSVVFAASMLPRALASAERITEVLATASSFPPATVPDRRGPLVPAAAHPWHDGHRPAIRLQNVNFGYPGARTQVLRDVCLSIPAGRTTAIVGSTGAGKTTLLNLMMRLHAPTSGRILFGDSDVAHIPLSQFWRHVGLVPQHTRLFSGSVADNLRLRSPEATEADIWYALETAMASAFVSALPEGLDTRLGQDGANVSGGERQRLAIARALVGHPDLLVLDDAMSALDDVTEFQVREQLRRRHPGITTVLVSQRVETVGDADRIVVLEGNRVSGAGTHDQLLSGNTTYREIVSAHLAGGTVS